MILLNKILFHISYEDDIRGFVDSENNFKVESISNLFRVAYEKLYWREIPVNFINHIAYIGDDEDIMVLNKEIVEIECYDEFFENKIKGELWINFSNRLEYLELIKYNGHFYIDDWTLMEIEWGRMALSKTKPKGDINEAVEEIKKLLVDATDEAFHKLFQNLMIMEVISVIMWRELLKIL